MSDNDLNSIDQEKAVMNDLAKKHLEMLRNAKWFAHVGKPSKKHIVLHSWQDAIKATEDESWESTMQEAVNDIWARIDKIDSQRREDLWNEYVDEMSNHDKSLVDEKTDHLAHFFHGKKFPKLTLVKIVRISCIELEYSDIITPSLYSMLANLVIDGRYPCGWKGSVPDSKTRLLGNPLSYPHDRSVSYAQPEGKLIIF
jgi:hypothetical protein